MKIHYSEKELNLISELRKLVADILEDEYEETNEFLITWIRYGNYDIKKAEQALRNNKKWRKEYNMDKILLEDMKNMDEEYPVHMSGYDNKGNPIMALQLNGDLRNTVDKTPEGKQLFLRHMIKLCEKTVCEIKKQYYLTGGKVNHFSAIVDMDGFNFRQLMSMKVISAMTELAKTAEDNYPGVTETLYVLNAPKTIKILLNIMKPFLSSDTLSRLKMFDTNKSKWKEALLQDISKDQLPSFIY